MKIFTGKITKTLICCCMRRPFSKQRRSRQGPKTICLSNGEISTEQENMRVLFKYQPADRILQGNTCRDRKSGREHGYKEYLES